MTAAGETGAFRPVATEAGERIVALRDERDPLARQALLLIEEAFAPQDRQGTDEILSEIEEDRLGLLASDGFHVLTALGDDGRPIGTVAGMYLAPVNAGFVTYLAVRAEHRGRMLARNLRTRLMEAFRADAREAEWDELAWVLGEVRAASPWLRRLVRHRGAIPFDLTYYHPGMLPGRGHTEYVLYRQPVGDSRPTLPAELVRQVLYAIYRRAYRVRYPLVHPGFRAMIEEIGARPEVGPHPRVEEWRAE